MTPTVVPVWQQVTPALADELVAFWRDHKAIASDEEARARAGQAVCVARDAGGALCGVGTAVVRVLPRLRQPTYYYRQFFARPLRGRGQELAFFQRCKQVLQVHNQQLAQPESLGILLEIENAKIAAAYRRAIEPGFEAVFIGYSPKGLPLRVSYFDDARLLPPAAPPARRAGAGVGRAT